MATIKHLNIRALFSLCTLMVMVVGCAKPHVILNRAVLLNSTDNTITDVRVFHEKTRKSGEVNALLPQTTLDVGFSGQPLLAKQAAVSWRNSAGIIRESTLELPYDFNVAKEGGIMNLIYIIHPSGTVTVRLEEVK